MIITHKPWARTSASQLGTYQRCPRKWWFSSVARLPTPTSSAMGLGSAVHAVLEDYLEHGTLPAVGHPRIQALPEMERERAEAVALVMIRNLPPGGSVAKENIERVFTWQPDGWLVPVKGIIDMVGTTYILDHKTTSNLQYAKTPDQLRDDPQAIIYCGYASRVLGIGAPVPFVHNYGQTKKRIIPGRAQVTMETVDIDRGLTYLGTLASQQLALGMEIDASKVPCNELACRDYGGCPFAARCAIISNPADAGIFNAITKERPSGAKKEKQMGSFLDKIKAAQAGTPAAPVPTPKPTTLAERIKASKEADRKWKEDVEAKAAVVASGKTHFDPAAEAAARAQTPWGDGIPGIDYLAGEANVTFSSPNPPDGTPDDVVVDPPKVKRPAHRYNGTLVNSLKKPDAVAAVTALVDGLTPEQTEAYQAASELPAKPKLADLREEIVLLMDIAKGTVPSAAPDLVGLAAREAQTKEPDIMDEIKRLNGVRDLLNAAADVVGSTISDSTNGGDEVELEKQLRDAANSDEDEAGLGCIPIKTAEPYTIEPEAPQQEATTMLLIGCVPVGMPAPMLMDVLEPLVDEFYRAQGVLPGCWKDYSVTGWDQIANGLFGAVEGGSLDLPAVLLVDRADPKPVVDVLVRYYDVVVRGV